MQFLGRCGPLAYAAPAETNNFIGHLWWGGQRRWNLLFALRPGEVRGEC